MKHSEALNLAMESSRGFPNQFEKPKHDLVFIHSYPNLDRVLMGMDVVNRSKAIVVDGVMLTSAKGLKEGQHVFLGLPRLKGVAKGYVEAIIGDTAFLSGMGSELEK